MAETAADVSIDTLHGWGVEVVFGLPGDGITGIIEALRKLAESLRSSPPRRIGRLHGVRLREIHRHVASASRRPVPRA